MVLIWRICCVSVENEPRVSQLTPRRYGVDSERVTSHADRRLLIAYHHLDDHPILHLQP